ncbi:hypothetical protein LEN26_013753 [Aphanomyces euteiches]|nr:hypothetical protein AeMF1_017229 [Aphanomyces euteiches]KAH9110460.1 hypothetical protein LEN26_013753 [Aphanomyces euteiches]KAH9184018.1 hypothetical protein AeNC1_014007 [Aphanomyces euteiches]
MLRSVSRLATPLRVRAYASSVESLAVRAMVSSFRRLGHLEAKLDPLGREVPASLEELAPASFSTLFSTPISPGSEVNFPHPPSDMQALYKQLRETYCGTVGVEIEHLRSKEERDWLAAEIENPSLAVTPAMERNAWTSMQTAESFEHFLAKKFSSFKRYSGEGAEAMMPAIQTIFDTAAQHGTTDIVIGMPHRGRLALLVGILKYPVHQLLRKIQGFTDFPEGIFGLDDVSSHIAQSVDLGPIHVSLLHNPSHLEIINPVTTGKVRAKQDSGKKAMALLLHGDAAFSGQGCVPEGLSLSQLPSFQTGGTVHIVVNNQVGFTTTRKDGRSTQYSTDVAKGFDIPVLHVNGEDIPAVIRAANIATQFRHKFGKDIIVDLVTYRRHGHNEVDEPRFTQPGMYGSITTRPSLPAQYGEHLVQNNLLTPAKIETLKSKLNAHLEAELQKSSTYVPTTVAAFEGNWKGLGQATTADMQAPVDTGVQTDVLKALALHSVTVPPSVAVHNRLERTHIQARQKMLEQDKVDWATAEAMAFGSLLRDGHSIRLAGQDCRRGTFSHRHAAFTDQNTDEHYFPFRHLPKELNPTGCRFDVVNSNLSELAVMGFEYGYSWEDPRALVLWEAQFGDFFNGAQIVIDQFVASSETKWMRQSGLVLLLPHGYDGAGPDHSSGKPERFLQFVNSRAYETSDDTPELESINLSIVNLTTPAQYFHVLRRQQLRDFRKPLIVFAPKTLLRLAQATSTLDDLAPGNQFHPVLGDSIPTQDVKRVFLVSGKLYYDLVAQREQHNRHDTAIIRVEEWAPFPKDALQAELSKYSNAQDIVWVQEEPANQGAWAYVKVHLDKIGVSARYIGRPSLPATAQGLGKANAKEAQELMRQAWEN